MRSKIDHRLMQTVVLNLPRFLSMLLRQAHRESVVPLVRRPFHFFLRFPKSTMLIYSATVMQWQMWTAFGIMLGYVSDLIFFKVPDPAGIVGLRWRLMMSSAMLPALVVIAFVFLCPESPRWYMSKDRHYKAYESMSRLRFNKVQAARDIFYMHTLLEAEKELSFKGQNKLKELISIPRNRRALVGSEIVMFMQQVSKLVEIRIDVFVDHSTVLWC